MGELTRAYARLYALYIDEDVVQPRERQITRSTEEVAHNIGQSAEDTDDTGNELRRVKAVCEVNDKRDCEENFVVIKLRGTDWIEHGEREESEVIRDAREREAEDWERVSYRMEGSDEQKNDSAEACCESNLKSKFSKRERR